MINIKLKKLHSGQQAVLQSAKRFNFLKIGRRFGKTTMAVNYLIPKIALSGKPVAYWAPTYTDLSEVWQEVLLRLRPAISKKNEQTKQIKLVTGGTIDFWSMSNPDSGRGREYARAIVDEAEKAKKFREAWQNTILPTLMDYKGDAWVLSTPKFGQTFFKELHATKKFNFASFNLSTYDNPYIDRDEIEEIRSTMDELSFRCEILAEDVDLSNNPFAYAFDEDTHVTSDVAFNENKPVIISFDFNVDPITAVASQGDFISSIHFLKEFVLPNSDIYELCDRINAFFPNAVFLVTGDATGRARSAVSKGNINYYQIIKMKLNLTEQQMKTPTINPAISDTRVLLNSMLQNGDVKFHPDLHWTIRDMKYVEVDDNGDIKKDRSNDIRKSDLLDTVRYTLNTFYRHFLKINK
jgi:hypothetical protein